MKKELEKFDIPKVKKINDSSMSKIFDKIMNTPACREFIDKYELTNKEIMDNFLPLLLVSENYEKCKNCNGLNNCPLEGVKGYFNVPVIDFYGTIDTEFKACKYMEERNLYIYRDFDDEKLNWLLTEKDVNVIGRNKILNLLGKLSKDKNTKGIYLYGDNGIGKSYLAICCANRIVKSEKKQIAYVDVKKFISEMTKLIYEDKSLFNEKLDIIKNAPYLFLDGLGNEKISKFTRDDIILSILEYRKEKNLKNTVIISKYDFKDLKKLYKVDNELQAESFVDLIKYMMDACELVGLNNFN
jgi:DNA replication protein DnaC